MFSKKVSFAFLILLPVFFLKDIFILNPLISDNIAHTILNVLLSHTIKSYLIKVRNEQCKV